jgi:hypothetical protein
MIPFNAVISLFQQGHELANSATWKQRSIATNVVVGVIGSALMIAKGCGYDLGIDQDTVDAIGAGIAAAVTAFNTVITIITSKKAGFPATT